MAVRDGDYANDFGDDLGGEYDDFIWRHIHINIFVSSCYLKLSNSTHENCDSISFLMQKLGWILKTYFSLRKKLKTNDGKINFKDNVRYFRRVTRFSSANVWFHNFYMV